MKALIFANGKAKDGVMVRRALAQADDARVIAADGGARIAWRYDLTPDIVIGDMDSLSSEDSERLAEQGAELHRYPTDKNETDLELTLLYAAQQGADWIRIVGGIGGRFDQMLANVYLLALPQLDGLDVAIVARNQMIRLLRPGDHTLTGAVGDTVSLIPVSGDVSGITTTSLQYVLEDDTLYFGPARGVSNVMQAQQATVSVQSGLLLCVHTEGKA